MVVVVVDTVKLMGLGGVELKKKKTVPVVGYSKGVSITCMQTNVQWPAYVASRYPLWPSEPGYLWR